MGIQDRDYMRDRMRKLGNDGTPPPVGALRWWLIIGAVVAIFIIIATIIDQRSKLPKAPPPVINVNIASLAELSKLPHIKQGVAQGIIDGRPYASVDDLIRVYNIGTKTLEAIRPYVKVKDDELQPSRSGESAQKITNP